MDIKKLKRYYNDQKFKSKSRLDKNGDPIQWLLTFDEWMAIWIASGKLHDRGRKSNQYCMSRKNDIGPYSTDNVEIIPNFENISSGQLGKFIPAKNGAKNPNAKQISIRGKQFSTMQEAAAYIGYTTAGLTYRIKKGLEWTS
jgi:hypothetical protein